MDTPRAITGLQRAAGSGRPKRVKYLAKHIEILKAGLSARVDSGQVFTGAATVGSSFR